MDPGRRPAQRHARQRRAGSATSSKKGFTFTKTFSKAGTFKYVCTIHSNMKVTVKVR